MGPSVSIIMGSDSDYDTVKEAFRTLKSFGIDYEVVVSSAHRSPGRTVKLARAARGRGIEVIIAAAGGAAHLAGIISAHTDLPVIGIPVSSSSLSGMDSLLSTVQMPSGVPVATMAIGKAGARNAAIMAARILALKYPEVDKRLKGLRRKMAREVNRASERVSRRPKE